MVKKKESTKVTKNDRMRKREERKQGKTKQQVTVTEKAEQRKTNSQKETLIM